MGRVEPECVWEKTCSRFVCDFTDCYSVTTAGDYEYKLLQITRQNLTKLFKLCMKSIYLHSFCFEVKEQVELSGIP